MGNCTSVSSALSQKKAKCIQDMFNQAMGPDANEENLAKLISSNVDVNTKIEHEGIGSCYPIHVATKIGNLKAVEMLIHAGADVKLLDDNGKEALHWAAAGNNEEILELLVKAGADINAKANDGTTPLKEAIIDKNDPMVEKLIELGAEVNLDDDDGTEETYPPLITAVKEDNALACLQLLQAAKISPTASVISSVRTWATENNHEFVLEQLEQKYPNGSSDEVPRQEGDGAEQKLDTAEEVTEDGGAAPEETAAEDAEAEENAAEVEENKAEEEPTEEPAVDTAEEVTEDGGARHELSAVEEAEIMEKVDEEAEAAGANAEDEATSAEPTEPTDETNTEEEAISEG